MMRGNHEITDQIERIESVLRQCAEELNDLSMTVLSAAIEAGDSARPEVEKKLSRARRTVERAIAQLSGVDNGDSD